MNARNLLLGRICTADFGKTDVAIILDVLHYISYEAQENVLRRIRASLPIGGTFITRIGDAAGGLPFHYSNWVDRTVFFLRGHRLSRIYCRTRQEWLEVLTRSGFDCRTTAYAQRHSVLQHHADCESNLAPHRMSAAMTFPVTFSHILFSFPHCPEEKRAHAYWIYCLRKIGQETEVCFF